MGLPKVANGKDRDGIGPNETKDKKCGPLLIQNPSTGYLCISPLLFEQIFYILLHKNLLLKYSFTVLLGIFVD